MKDNIPGMPPLEDLLTDCGNTDTKKSEETKSSDKEPDNLSIQSQDSTHKRKYETPGNIPPVELN